MVLELLELVLELLELVLSLSLSYLNVFLVSAVGVGAWVVYKQFPEKSVFSQFSLFFSRDPGF